MWPGRMTAMEVTRIQLALIQLTLIQRALIQLAGTDTASGRSVAGWMLRRLTMVSREVAQYAADGVLIAGGARAILLQVADPTVAAGVAKHSDFAHRPVQRLRNTLTFAYAVVLGTVDDANRVASYVNRAHVPVARAEDAELQLWVAATLYDTATSVHDRVFGAVATELADELYREYAALGTSLQMPAELWPASRAEFRSYWDARVGSLHVTEDARQIAHDLFAPVTAPAWLRAGLPLARLLTIDLLPASIRDAYGFEWTPREARRAARAWGVIRFLARVTPYRLRSWPSRHYLRRLRAGGSR
jgi:uncharacterized protein (DUF2236 family)